jgi:hypothetical protein
MTAAASVPGVSLTLRLHTDLRRKEDREQKKEEVDWTRLQDGGADTCGPLGQVEPVVPLSMFGTLTV